MSSQHKLYINCDYYITVDEEGYLTRSITCLEGAMGYVIRLEGKPPLAWKIPRLVGDSVKENAYVAQLLDTEADNVRAMAGMNCDALMSPQLILRNPFESAIIGIRDNGTTPTPAENPIQRLLVSFEKGRPPRFCTIQFQASAEPRFSTSTAAPSPAMPTARSSQTHGVVVRPTTALRESIAANLEKMRLDTGPTFHAIPTEAGHLSARWEPMVAGSEREREPIGWYQGLPSIIYSWAHGTLQEAISTGCLREWTLKQRYSLTRRILEGIAALHSRGLLHGDLRPANIMYMNDAKNANDYKVTDYGSLATGRPDMFGATAGAEGSGRTVLQAIHNARVSAFYAPERRNGFEHEEADTAIISRALDGKGWLIILGWRSALKALQDADSDHPTRPANSDVGADRRSVPPPPPRSTRSNEVSGGSLGMSEFIERVQQHLTRPVARAQHPTDSDHVHAGKILLEKGDRIRLREFVFQIAAIAPNDLADDQRLVSTMTGCTVLLCESTVWKVFNERMIVQADDFSQEIGKAKENSWVDFSLPKIVELYQWSQATDTYAIGVLLLYLCFPRQDPGTFLDGSSLPSGVRERIIEQEFMVLLDHWANPLYCNQMWTQVHLVCYEILRIHAEIREQPDKSPKDFGAQEVHSSAARRIFTVKEGEGEMRARNLYESILQVVNNLCETSPHARRVLASTFNWNIASFLLFVDFVFACLHRQEDLKVTADIRSWERPRSNQTVSDVESTSEMQTIDKIPSDFDVLLERMESNSYPFSPGRIDRPTNDKIPAHCALSRLTRLEGLCESPYLAQMRAENVASYEPKSQAETLLDNANLKNKLNELRKYRNDSRAKIEGVRDMKLSAVLRLLGGESFRRRLVEQVDPERGGPPSS